MGLGNLFRPKWQSSNPAARRKAVDEIIDQKLLAHLAFKDPDIHVKLTAQKNWGSELWLILP